MESMEYEQVRNLTLLFFFERLIDKNEPRTLHDLSCQFGAPGFTKEMRQIAGGSESGKCNLILQTEAFYLRCLLSGRSLHMSQVFYFVLLAIREQLCHCRRTPASFICISLECLHKNENTLKFFSISRVFLRPEEVPASISRAVCCGREPRASQLLSDTSS